ncbi:hypothetical protein [Chitinophaga varians]|uniref:hypothetical protein n=1 Tax=Chitinophaga varians TaxID=2202339 RepID=UPI0016600642|nr:hypothetical protein [Chitinophaga varians]MBC9910274.1 hypothetical protein [Chitinophaga varians]
MKKLLFSVLVGGIFVNCTMISTVAANHVSPVSSTTVLQQVYFHDVEEFLAQYEPLLNQGHVYTLALEPGKGVYIVSSPASISSATDLLAVRQHSYSTKDRLKFAKWCNDQLNKGNVLTIGKDKDGTYWADIK